jgi:hypothetical protein
VVPPCGAGILPAAGFEPAGPPKRRLQTRLAAPQLLSSCRIPKALPTLGGCGSVRYWLFHQLSERLPAWMGLATGMRMTWDPAADPESGSGCEEPSVTTISA